MNKNGSSRKSFLGSGKRKQQKKLPVTWETEVAEKASWDLGKRKQQKKLPGT
jgi:hypothetical protein